MRHCIFIGLICVVYHFYLTKVVEGESENELMLHGENGTSSQVIRMCCSKDEVFDSQKMKCVSLTNMEQSTPSKVRVLSEHFYFAENNMTPIFTNFEQGWDQYKYEVVKLTFNDFLGMRENQVEISGYYEDHFEFVHLYDTSDYCIDIEQNSSVGGTSMLEEDVVYVKSLPYVTSYIRLCCGNVSESLDSTLSECRESYQNESMDLRTVLEDVSRVDLYDVKKPEDVTVFLFGIPDCGPYHIKTSRIVPFKLYNTGNIKIKGTTFNHNAYCLSSVKPISANSPNLGHSAAVIRCEYPWRTDLVNTYIASALLLISDAFLLGLMVNLLMNSTQKLFGAMEVSVILNLFFYNFTISIAKLWSPESYNQLPISCLILGFVIQFSYLSVMFWLNAMSFDVWSTFRYMRSRDLGPTLSSPKLWFEGFKCQKYRYYALYGWGIPLLVTFVTITMQFLPPYITDGYTTPGIGEENCFLRSQWASFFYLYMFAGMALIFNLVLFALFAWNLWFGIWSKRDLEHSNG